MSNGYVSDELFHFVGNESPENDEQNYETLLKIIDSKCISHPPHENGWGDVNISVNLEASLEAGELIVPTVTCYCDIPAEFLKIHIKKYGKFGLSFKKEKLAKYGARPVMYMPYNVGDDAPHLSTHGRALLRNIEVRFRGIRKQLAEGNFCNISSLSHTNVPGNVCEAIEASKRMIEKEFLAFLKPFDLTLDEDHLNNFYMEREWRKFGNFPFSLDDISSVYVAEGYEGQVRTKHPEITAPIATL